MTIAKIFRLLYRWTGEYCFYVCAVWLVARMDTAECSLEYKVRRLDANLLGRSFLRDLLELDEYEPRGWAA